MDCGTKTLIFFTLCAFVGAKIILEITTDLEILISVPSTHIGDTEIVRVITGGLIYGSDVIILLLRARKNQTQCINSTDPLCSSLIKAPAVDVTVTSRSSDGKYFIYSDSINRSLSLDIRAYPEFSVTHENRDGERDSIRVDLRVRYDPANTRRNIQDISIEPTISRLNVEFISTNTTIKGEDNGQSILRCAPVSALILLALTPLLLLQ